jgi:hypothetical protein
MLDHVTPCWQLDSYSLCEMTYQFRGTSSNDPDDDIVSWSIDFGDGSAVGGDWATSPPTDVAHTDPHRPTPTCAITARRASSPGRR